MLGECKPGKRLDFTQIDSTYFVGSYSCDYGKKTERLVLKADGTYDYYWLPNNVEIENAGNWFFFNGKYPTLHLSSFPNYRKTRDSHRDRINLHFNVNGGIKAGNLETLMAGEEWYIFKPDERKEVR